MWVSRKRFEALEGRVFELEQSMKYDTAFFVGLPNPYASPETVSVKNVVRKLLNELGYELERKPEEILLTKKGGPERG